MMTASSIHWRRLWDIVESSRKSQVNIYHRYVVENESPSSMISWQICCHFNKHSSLQSFWHPHSWRPVCWLDQSNCLTHPWVCDSGLEVSKTVKFPWNRTVVEVLKTLRQLQFPACLSVRSVWEPPMSKAVNFGCDSSSWRRPATETKPDGDDRREERRGTMRRVCGHALHSYIHINGNH